MNNLNYTSTFKKNLSAYLNGYNYIINEGSSRSGKTFSILQLIDQICNLSNEKLIFTIVSHSLPHLEGGAIRDFDAILTIKGIDVNTVRTKRPYIYRINNSIVEFVGFDKPGKALGAARDYLFINEANKMNFDICHQLMKRTRFCTFIDYNPANDFWADDIKEQPGSFVIHSTFLDNIQNLTEKQISDFENDKHKADEEEKNDKKGYWYNFWRVYGLGLKGILEGVILTNWTVGEFDKTLPYGYAIDFGVKHFDGMVKCAINQKEKLMYVHEEIYRNGLNTDQLTQIIQSKNVGNSLIIGDSAASRTILDLRNKGLNIYPIQKARIVEDIKEIMNYKLIITPESKNVINSLNKWIWLDKKGEIPIDEFDDLIDPIRYYFRSIIGRPRLTIR